MTEPATMHLLATSDFADPPTPADPARSVCGLDVAWPPTRLDVAAPPASVVVQAVTCRMCLDLAASAGQVAPRHPDPRKDDDR